jgi:TolA-binding protein
MLPTQLRSHRIAFAAALFTAGATTVVAMSTSPSRPPQSSAASDDDAPRLRAGLGFLERGLDEMALVELDAFLAEGAKAGGSPARRLDAFYARGIALLRLGRSSEARVALDEAAAAATFAFRLDALLLCARCAFDGGDAPAAIERLDRLLGSTDEFPARDAALALRGEALLAVGRPGDARRDFDALVAQHPASSGRDRAALLAAHASALQGDDADAAARLTALLLRFEARKDSEQPPEAAPALRMLAESLHRLRRLDEAAEAYRAAGRAAVGDERARMLLAAASIDRSLGRAASAQRSLDAIDEAGLEEPALRTALAVERVRRALDEGRTDDAAAALAGVDRAALAQGDADAVLLLEATIALRSNRGLDAVRAADAIARRTSNAPEVLDALLIVADGHAQAERWLDAADAYGRFAERAVHSPVRGDALVRRGLALHAADRVDEAETLLRSVLADTSLALDPTVERLAWAKLLDTSMRGERWADARSDATRLRAFAREEDDPAFAADTELRAAVAAARLGDTNDALARLDALLAAHADEPRAAAAIDHARFERGCLLAQAGRAEEAAVDFDAVLGSDSAAGALRDAARRRQVALALARGRTGEADALLGAGDPTRVDLAALAVREGRLADAEASLRGYLATSTNKDRVPEATARLAIVIARLGRLEEAVEASTRALDALPPTSASNDEHLAALRMQVLFERSTALASLGRLDEAAIGLTSLLEQPSTYRPFAALELARTALDAGRHDEAAARATTALETSGEAAEADRPTVRERSLYVLGTASLRKGDLAGGDQALEALLAEFPASQLAPSVRVALGTSLVARKEERGAIAVLEPLADRLDELDQALAEAALLKLGEARALDGRHDGALAAYREHRRRFPTSQRWFHAAFGIGWALESRGDFDAAIVEYRAIVDAHRGPTAARAQFQIGECLFAQRKFEDAARELLKTDLLFGETEWTPAALYESARAFTELGRFDEARAQLATLRANHGTSHWATLATAEEARIDQLLRAAADDLPGRAP